MSILIKGIEMPKEPWECPCHNGENGNCKVTGHSCYDVPKDCPLIEVNDDAEPIPHWRGCMEGCLPFQAEVEDEQIH